MIKACINCKEHFDLYEDGLEVVTNINECEYHSDMTGREHLTGWMYITV